MNNNDNNKLKPIIGGTAIYAAIGYVIGVHGQFLFLKDQDSLGPIFGLVFVLPISVLIGIIVSVLIRNAHATGDKKKIFFIISAVVYTIVLFNFIVLNYKPSATFIEASILSCNEISTELDKKIDYWKQIVAKQRRTKIAQIPDDWENTVDNMAELTKKRNYGAIVEYKAYKSMELDRLVWANGRVWYKKRKINITETTGKAFLEAKLTDCRQYLGEQSAIFKLYILIMIANIRQQACRQYCAWK